MRSSRATTASPRSTGSCSPTTAGASSRRPAASAVTCSRACSPAVTTRHWPRPAASRRSSAATTSSSSCRTTASPEQHRTNPQLVEIAKQLGAPLLATNDSHYTSPGDAEAHDALLCVQTGALISQSADERFKFSGTGHYLKTAAEMRHLFAELDTACDNTLWVAERANVEIEFGKPLAAPLPAARGVRLDDGEYLRQLTFEGARQRWGDDASRHRRRAARLRAQGHRRHGVLGLLPHRVGPHPPRPRVWTSASGPGAGSAAGCAVAYCLRITDLDPIRYDLLFERFLNPSRISMPDIDMDFDSRYRDEMIRYAAERYGRDHVAQIVTFSTIKARAAVRDAARVLGLPVRASATGSPRPCRRSSWGATRRCTPASNSTRSSRTATRRRPSCASCARPTPT